MIWASFLSMIITLPVGYIVAPFVFGGTTVQESATSYFTCVLWGNFLFPLQAALSSFFIGQNKAKIVFITVIGAQCLHILLDYLLIFGVENYIPSLGVLGAAIALVINRAVVCGVLFFLFGKRYFSAIRRVVMRAFLLLGMIMAVLAVPFILCAPSFLSFLFPTFLTCSSMDLLLTASYTSWLYLLCEGFLLIGMGLLAA